MSNARSPRDVCSTTIGTRGLMDGAVLRAAGPSLAAFGPRWAQRCQPRFPPGPPSRPRESPHLAHDASSRAECSGADRRRQRGGAEDRELPRAPCSARPSKPWGLASRPVRRAALAGHAALLPCSTPCRLWMVFLTDWFKYRPIAPTQRNRCVCGGFVRVQRCSTSVPGSNCGPISGKRGVTGALDRSRGFPDGPVIGARVGV